MGEGIDEYFVRTDSAGLRTPLGDSIDSSIALADSSGTVQSQYTYEPFGKTSISGSSSANSYQYTSRENDGLLLYYRARYYHPGLQRFLSEDQLEFAGGDINLYLYVSNDPVNLIDPLGLTWLDDNSEEIASFCAGLGDVCLMGYGDQLREAYQDAFGWGQTSLINPCSKSYTAGEWTGVIITIVLARGAGGTKGPGMEFSHAIPDRMLKHSPTAIRHFLRVTFGKSLLNGNYVTKMNHMLNDPWRYRFMPRVDKFANPINPAYLRYWIRIPNMIKGSGVGFAGKALNKDCECK